MKKILFFIITTFYFFNLVAQQVKYEISFVQNDQEIKPIENQITLSKSSFQFLLKAENPMSIKVNASWKSDTYDAAANKDLPFVEFLGFTESGMADDLKNPNQAIFIDDEAPNYWFFDSETEHRFDEIKKMQEEWVCPRTIKLFHDLEINRKIKVEQVLRPLYLVVVHAGLDNDGNDIEYQRDRIKINWK